MPHFKCLVCKARLYAPASPGDQVGDLCPGCGSLLDPVGELSEIVGFQSIKPRDGGAAGAPGAHQRIADRIGDLLERRAARDADAETWLDDSGGFSPEGAARASALPTPEKNP